MRIAWNESAESYRKAMRPFEPYSFDRLARVNPKIREAALDLATGLGEPAMGIARMVGPMLEFAEPDETGYRPTPFELGGPGELTKLLADAGFLETLEERRTHTMAFRDEDEYIEILMEGTPLGRAIKEEDPSVQKKILASTRANLRKWKSRKGIQIPCEGVIVTATK